VKPHGEESGVFFCGVCITVGSLGVAVHATDAPAGVGGNNPALAFAWLGEETAAKAPLIDPPANPGLGLKLPNNLGKGRPHCALGDGVGGMHGPGDGLSERRAGARGAMDNTLRTPYACVELQAGLGEGVGANVIRVGVGVSR